MDVRLDVERIDQATALDPAVKVVRNAVNSALPPGPLRDTLNGVWLGHPLHPLLTDVALGLWTGALVLDAVGGKKRRAAADRLIALGVLSALPTAAAGAADWSELDPPELRAGLVHAAANTTAVVLFSWSWLARKRGRRARGKLLALAGAGATTVGGYLGGHLTYRLGAGVSRNAFEQPPSDWVDVIEEAGLAEGKPVGAKAGDVPIVLYRENGRIAALSSVCSHVGGPLDEGEVKDGCVVCPWHGSTFQLDTGAVVHGPAASPQPVFDTRVQDGKVQVKAKVRT